MRGLKKFRRKTILPISRSNQNQNPVKPKIWRGSIIGWLWLFVVVVVVVVHGVRDKNKYV